jgi:hypothetical protein
MSIFISDESKRTNVPALLREAGYRQEVHRGTGQISYVRSVSGGDFPRFHIYIDKADKGWQVNLHLDQKKPTYEGTSAHAGEYDGKVVGEEAGRLRRVWKIV